MIIKYLLFINLLFFLEVQNSPVKIHSIQTCASKSCHPVDPNKINVHLIPHSHDDVGWLKTVDQYYYGSRNFIQNAGVQYIITSTIAALKANPNRRFIQVETAFFWKWWQNQDKSAREDFSNLVNNGQLEIINAAWSMNDEATANYQSTIDQFTWGLKVINDTLGKCGAPKIGWQIDPFGHSREQASIFARLGYDAVFFARIDFNDKEQRIKDKTMEVIWKGSANLDNTNIFASAFPDFYYPPNGFCYDIGCDDDVINDDLNSPDYNVPKIKNNFTKIIKSMAQYYRTNNILIPMGGDFQYQAAEKNFINTDRLIKAFENDDEVNLIYSTPTCYVQAVNEAAKANGVTFSQKNDDYFPYASDTHCYWTGYFTSRPNAKRFERKANNILQAAKQLAVFSRVLGKNYDDKITNLRDALGILQHHDAITGTAKQAVANDYSRLLTKAIKSIEVPMGLTINNLLQKDPVLNVHLNWSFCLLSNVSICKQSNGDHFLIAVYNPLAHEAVYEVRLPVPGGVYKITGRDGELPYDVTKSISTFSYLKALSPSSNELVFMDFLRPTINLYNVEKINDITPCCLKINQTKFGTNLTNFEIDYISGLLKTVTMNGQTLAITQEFLYYRSANGSNFNETDRASGAYIFRPMENKAIPLSLQPVKITVTVGNVVDEVHQVYNSWVTQIIRVYKVNASWIEFDWLVGPIEVDEKNKIGSEIISRFTVKNFKNKGTFYTDSNGRELIKRQINQRYDYKYNYTFEPVSSNYYPVTSRIVIKDEEQNLEVAVLNDRAQGGSSLREGEVELMIHRRLLKDDAKGVDEALNETEYGQGIVVRGKHYLFIGVSKNEILEEYSATRERILTLKKQLAPIVMVADAGNLSLDKIQSAFNFEFNYLKKSLPSNVHLLTLEPWNNNAVLLRLEHFLEKGEYLAQPAVVDLSDLFTLFNVKEIRETTLGANQWLDELNENEKLVWRLENGKNISQDISSNSIVNDIKNLNVTLSPMEIRTFIMRISNKHQ